MNTQIQFLGQHPNGSFFITKDAQKIAQAVADNDGFRYWEFAKKNKTITIKEIASIADSALPAEDLEVKTVTVAGEDILVATLTPKAKEARDNAIKVKAEARAVTKEAERKESANETKEERRKRKAEENERLTAEAEAAKEKIAEGEAQAQIDAEADIENANADS